VRTAAKLPAQREVGNRQGVRTSRDFSTVHRPRRTPILARNHRPQSPWRGLGRARIIAQGRIQGMSKVKLTTSHGPIVLELDAAKAPATVENFLQYVTSGHYDGTIFHRVIQTFMIQGGGFTPGMRQKPTGTPLKNEATNGLKNKHYTVAMARTSDPHSATAQFFINTSDNSFLDHTSPSPQGWGYAVFGTVVEGRETVDAIAAVSTSRSGGHDDVPTEDVTITKAEVL
jgi:peptidyl-prolyl cis-trans isomerase B (cyclophilin B)